jgi:hypothetical protein
MTVTNKVINVNSPLCGGDRANRAEIAIIHQAAPASE